MWKIKIKINPTLLAILSLNRICPKRYFPNKKQEMILNAVCAAEIDTAALNSVAPPL